LAVEIAPERDADQKITADLDNPQYQARVAEALAAGLLEWRTEGRQP
jgi:mannitol-1-phosphate/altronate dehydrogenase